MYICIYLPPQASHMPKILHQLDLVHLLPIEAYSPMTHNLQFQTRQNKERQAKLHNFKKKIKKLRTILLLSSNTKQL